MRLIREVKQKDLLETENVKNLILLIKFECEHFILIQTMYC